MMFVTLVVIYNDAIVGGSVPFVPPFRKAWALSHYAHSPCCYTGFINSLINGGLSGTQFTYRPRAQGAAVFRDCVGVVNWGGE